MRLPQQQMKCVTALFVRYARKDPKLLSPCPFFHITMVLLMSNVNHLLVMFDFPVTNKIERKAEHTVGKLLKSQGLRLLINDRPGTAIIFRTRKHNEQSTNNFCSLLLL